MKFRNIGLGIFIISIGFFWLLMNLGVINWSIFNSIYDLWPLAFVAVGISIIFRHNSIVRVLVWVLFLATLAVYGFAQGEGWIDKSSNTTSGIVSIEKEGYIKNANLKLSLGDSDIKLHSGNNDSKLLEGTIPKRNISRSIINHGDTFNISYTQKHFISFGPDGNGKVDLGLNNSVNWNITLNTGDFDGKIDFSDLNANNIDINSGDSDLDLKLGNKNKNTRITVNAGDTDTKLTLPDKTGVRVTINAGDYDTNMGNLGWTKNGHTYISPDYDSAEVKVEVTLNMGDGNFNVNLLK